MGLSLTSQAVRHNNCCNIAITLKIPRSDTGLCPIRGGLPTLSARSSSNYYRYRDRGRPDAGGDGGGENDDEESNGSAVHQTESVSLAVGLVPGSDGSATDAGVAIRAEARFAGRVWPRAGRNPRRTEEAALRTPRDTALGRNTTQYRAGPLRRLCPE